MYMEQNNSSATSSNTSTWTCHQYESVLYGDYAFGIIPPLAIIILAFFEKRKSYTKCSNGRPGLPVPINIIDNDDNAMPIATAFGCTIFNLYYVLVLKTDSKEDREPWLSSFYLLYDVIKIGIMYYPVFACLNSSWQIAAAVLGFLYTSLLFFFTIAEGIICETVYTLNWEQFSPILICEGVILCVFGFRVLSIFKCRKSSPQVNKHLARPHQSEYVKKLLKGYENSTDNDGFKSFFRQEVEEFRENATRCCMDKSLKQFTTRSLVINFVVFMCFYQFCLTFVEITKLVYRVEDGLKKVLTTNDILNSSTTTTIIKQTSLFVEVTLVSLIIAQVLAAVYTFSNMMFSYYSQRQHLKKMWRGDKSFIPTKCLEMSSSDMMLKSLMYAGTQVSHLLGGYILAVLVIYCIGLLFSYLLVLPLAGKVSSSFLNPAKFFVPSIIATLAFVYSLKYLSYMLFLQNECVTKDKDAKPSKVFALNNRRLYHNFSFFLFFFYILIGLFKCVRRVIYSCIVGIFFIPRLDKSVLVSGYEHFDSGYKLYVSLLQLELYHCHPILVVFCDLLCKSVSKHTKRPAFDLYNTSSLPVDSNINNDLPKTYNPLIQNRWWKIATLSANPTLCKLSKTNNNFEGSLNGNH